MNQSENQTPESAQPQLLLPGKAVRVALEVAEDGGRDSLQRAIIGLIRAGVPGDSGSLGRELCMQERMVELALKALVEESVLTVSENGTYALTQADADQIVVTVRHGWAFWDCLQKRVLPTILLDLDGSSLARLRRSNKEIDEAPPAIPETDLLEESGTPENEDRGSSGIPGGLPRRDDLRALVCGVADSENFSAVSLDSENRTRRHCMSCSAIGLAGSLDRTVQDFPLMVPYDIQFSLGPQPSIYASEPVICGELADLSRYSPYLIELIGKAEPELLEEVNKHAKKLQKQWQRERIDHGLADAQEWAALNAEARAVVISQLGGTSNNLLADREMIDLATVAEKIFLLSRQLKIPERSVRQQFAGLFSQLCIRISELMLPLWENSPVIRDAAKRVPDRKRLLMLEVEWNRRKLQWRRVVEDFETQYRFGIEVQFCPVPGTLRNNATYEYSRTGLGKVIWTLYAYPILVGSKERGPEILDWLLRAESGCNGLFGKFWETTSQRNVDEHNRPRVDGIPIESYRANIYRIWFALASSVPDF